MATTQRTIRIADALWQRFAEFCNRHEISMSERIVEHIEADVAELDSEGSKSA